MFVLREHAQKPDGELIEKLMKVEPATVGHFRHYGFMHRSIRPVIEGSKVVGPALTVRTPGPDSTILHKAMDFAEPGDIIVIDRCGDTVHACWGGVVTLAAQIKGVAGGIVDGPATDADEIAEIGFPLYCRGVTAITTKLMGIGGEINTVVQCGGVTVHPGDIVVADTNGILVLRPDEAKEVAEKALNMQEQEKPLIEKIKKGLSLPEASGANAIIAAKMDR